MSPINVGIQCLICIPTITVGSIVILIFFIIKIKIIVHRYNPEGRNRLTVISDIVL